LIAAFYSLELGGLVGVETIRLLQLLDLVHVALLRLFGRDALVDARLPGVVLGLALLVRETLAEAKFDIWGAGHPVVEHGSSGK
jgi:hypothetical protein